MGISGMGGVEHETLSACVIWLTRPHAVRDHKAFLQAEKVGNNLTKQEVLVDDSTGKAILTLWEQQTDSLELLESYYLTKPNVRIFRGQHTLSYPQFDASFTTIEDIGDVLEEEDEPAEPSMEGVEIGGVKDLARYKTCILSICKAKILVADDLVTCEKCNTSEVAQLAKTKLMAKLILIEVDLKPHTFVAPEEMLRNILSVCGQADTDITLEALLKIKRPFNITYDLIQSVSR